MLEETYQIPRKDFVNCSEVRFYGERKVTMWFTDDRSSFHFKICRPTSLEDPIDQIQLDESGEPQFVTEITMTAEALAVMCYLGISWIPNQLKIKVLGKLG